jgi:exodeoxyribonuclease-5
MLTAEDRKIRVVDSSLELLAQGIGSAISMRFPGESIERMLENCPKVKIHQRELFQSAASDPSSMLLLAIEKAEELGVKDSEFHKLKDFRNAVAHKRGSARARQVALDSVRVQDELLRAATVLGELSQPSLESQVKRSLVYYLQGAPEEWKDDPGASIDESVLRQPAKPQTRKSRKKPKVVISEGDLSPDQAEAVSRVHAWWKGSGRRFVVTGSAGTGKTRLIVEILARLGLTAGQVALVAPTNKACDVLREKLPANLGFRGVVSTFHSLLYRYRWPAAWDGEDQKWEIIGHKPRKEGVALLICDEASMLADLDVEAMEDNYRVVYLGDAAQLPAIVEDRVWHGRQAVASDILERPDSVLTTIHRQSGGSSILDAADIVRQGEFLEPGLWDDDATQVLHEDDGHVDGALFRQLLRDSDAVLVARNATRVRLNQLIRSLRGFERFPGDWLPKPGELLVTIERASDSDFVGQPLLSNGQQLVVDRVVRIGEDTKRSSGEPFEYAVVEAHCRDNPAQRGTWPISQEMLVGKHVVGDEVITKNIAGPRSKVLRCDWGYALTVHKAQGSEWGRVLVVDHGAYDKVGQRQWNYVALTRARSTVTVVRLRKDSALLA